MTPFTPRLISDDSEPLDAFSNAVVGVADKLRPAVVIYEWGGARFGRAVRPGRVPVDESPRRRGCPAG